MGARVVEEELPIGRAEEALGPDGVPREPELAARLAGVVAQLVQETGVPLQQVA